jgi:hypothetical protein
MPHNSRESDGIFGGLVRRVSLALIHTFVAKLLSSKVGTPMGTARDADFLINWSKSDLQADSGSQTATSPS